MSILGKLRSFAEARETDDTIIRDGFTYKDAREGVRAIEGLKRMVDEAADAFARIEEERKKVRGATADALGEVVPVAINETAVVAKDRIAALEKSLAEKEEERDVFKEMFEKQGDRYDKLERELKKAKEEKGRLRMLLDAVAKSPEASGAFISQMVRTCLDEIDKIATLEKGPWVESAAETSAASTWATAGTYDLQAGGKFPPEQK